MKLSSLLIAASLSLGVTGAAHANAELAKAKNCLACHAIDKKLVGPAYKDVAAKYAKDKGAEARLIKKVREGGGGVWGPGSVMPANPQVNADEAGKLVKWVLSQK